MATIPLGDFGQAVARPAPVASIPRGDPIGQAAERTGQIAGNVVNDLTAQQTRLDLQAAAEQRRKDEEAQQAAIRAKTITTLHGTKDRLADLSDAITQGVLDGSVPKEGAAAEYAKQSAKTLEGVGADLPDANRQIVLAELGGDAARLGNLVRKAVTQRDRQDVTSGINQTLEYLQRQYKADPAKATRQAMDTVDALGPHSTMGPDQLAKRKQDWKEGTQYTAGYEMVSAGRNDRKTLDAAEQAISNLPDLDPQKRATLLDRVSAYRLHLDQKAEISAQRAQREQERQYTRAATSYNAAIDQATAGTLSPEYADQVLQDTAGTPLQAAFKQMLARQKETGPLAARTLEQQRTVLATINADITTNGIDPQRAELRKRHEHVLAAAEADIKKLGSLDAYAKRAPGFVVADLNLTAGLPGIAQGIAARIQQSEEVSGWTGKPESPLRPMEAEGLARLIRVMPPEQRADALAMFSNGLPAKQMQALGQQISQGKDDDQTKAMGFALRLGATKTTAGRNASELLFKGAEALKADTIKEEKAAIDGWSSQIATQLQGVYLNQEQANEAAQAARLFMAGIVSEGGSANVRQAVGLAVGGHVKEHNGARIVVPAGFELTDVRKRTGSMTLEEVKAQAPTGKIIAGGATMTPEQFLAALPDAKLQYVSRGRYYVRAGRGLVSNEKLEPIMIEVAPGAR